MFEENKMNRINELARLSKERELDEAEKTEQAALREEYLESFREGLKAQLDMIEFVDVDPEGEILERLFKPDE